jgi:GNAT superfamily N-acetyltransferase
MPITDVTIWYLETTRADFAPKHADPAGVTFSKVDPVMPELNRFLYSTIGAPWYWLERRGWTHEQWSSHLASPDGIETWLLAVHGVPAGYVELHRRGTDVVEIDYLGLHRAFIGRGLGAHLLTVAAERAFGMGAEKVIVNTCTLDHSGALANYLARGFREVGRGNKTATLPDEVPGPWDGSETHDARDLLRHAVAVVAYRGGKALRGAPASFADFHVGPSTRTPIRILAHINDLYDWALALAKGTPSWRDTKPEHWDHEVARFFRALQSFDEYLASPAHLNWSAERLVSGPIADSLTHIGQLNMLRRLAGSPVKGENYARAEISAGRVGASQSSPVVEFD